MKINHDLNVYNDEKKDLQFKEIFKKGLLLFVIFSLLFSFLTIFFHPLLLLLIGFLIGSIFSFVLFYLTNKWINESYYADLKKISKKLHFIYQMVYLFTFAITGIIFQSYWIIIGLVFGFLLVKLSIFISKKD